MLNENSFEFFQQSFQGHSTNLSIMLTHSSSNRRTDKITFRMNLHSKYKYMLLHVCRISNLQNYRPAKCVRGVKQHSSGVKHFLRGVKKKLPSYFQICFAANVVIIK